MDRSRLSILNPNYYNGCHPLNPNNHTEAPPFCQDLDLKSPHCSYQNHNSSPQIPARRRMLEYLLDVLPRSSFPAKTNLKPICIISTGGTAVSAPCV